MVWLKHLYRGVWGHAHHWLESSGIEPQQSDNLTILYVYCTGGTECLSHTPGSHSACTVRTRLGVDRKILPIRKEPMLIFFTLNAQSILSHAGKMPEHWRLKLEASWVRLPAAASLFTFLYFHLITSKFIYDYTPVCETGRKAMKIGV